MSLTFRKGPFPFPIVPESTVTGPGNILTVSLQQLSKMFWLLKSYDYSFDFAWNYTSGSGASTYNINDTLTGAVTGMVVETVPTVPRATGVLPAERVVFDNLVAGFPISNQFSGGSGSIAYSGSSTSGTAPPVPFSGSSAGSIATFFAQIESAIIPVVPFNSETYISQSSTNYLARMASVIVDQASNTGTTPPFNLMIGSQDQAATVATPISTGIPITLKCTGFPDITTPIYYGLTGSGSISFSGTGVVINCNNFWTP